MPASASRPVRSRLRVAALWPLLLAESAAFAIIAWLADRRRARAHNAYLDQAYLTARREADEFSQARHAPRPS